MVELIHSELVQLVDIFVDSQLCSDDVSDMADIAPVKTDYADTREIRDLLEWTGVGLPFSS